MDGLMTADTPGKRVYLIRLALGDGLRTPMPMADFATLLTAQGRGRYDSSTISKIENEMRKVTLEEAPAFAAIDPQKRGASWVAWGEMTTPHSGEQGDRYTADQWRDVTAEAEAALAAEEAEQASTTAPRKNAGRKR